MILTHFWPPMTKKESSLKDILECDVIWVEDLKDIKWKVTDLRNPYEIEDYEDDEDDE